MQDEEFDDERRGWAISLGPGMSGVVPVGDPDDPPPVISAVLPDGRELVANEHGALDVNLPPGARIIADQLALQVMPDGDWAPVASRE